MYYGSDEFNSAIENTTGNALKLRLTFTDGTIVNEVSSAVFYGGSNDAEDISIGNTVLSYVDMSIYSNRNLTNEEFLLECGAMLSDGTYEYAPIGYFTIQTPYGDVDGVSFTAYDRMQKFEKPYTSSLTYPTTSAKVLNELCTICGIELATPIANPITIAENLQGYTCREILGYIAGIHGFFACIDRFGELNLRWYSTEAIDKPLCMMWLFEKSQEQYIIEKVELHKDSETLYESGNGVRALYHSNPYSTQEIADSLFNKLGGFTYTPAEIDMLDDVRLDPWDIVKVTYYDGLDYYVPAMAIQHDFGGGSTTIRAVGRTETESEYQFDGPLVRYMNRMSTELLIANRVIATKVDAEYVQAHAITVDRLDAITADIKNAVIGELSADFVTTDRLEAEVADIETLISGKLSASELSTEVAKLGYVTASQVSANYATIAQLNATNATVSGKLSASEADLRYATIESLEANYADIKLANVAVADIGALFADVGLITSATIVDGHITGYLDAVEVNANKITVGTLSVDRLVFRGANSIVYELNNITGALQAVQGNTLNGEILTDRSITVDKIVANSITANEIAAGAITASELATNAVTAVKIASNAVTTDKIQAGAITAEKLSVDSLSAITADLGTVTAGLLKSPDESMIINLEDASITTYDLQSIELIYGSGKIYHNFVITGNSISWQIGSERMFGSAYSKFDVGKLTLNDTVFRSGSVSIDDNIVLAFNREGSIYTPKVNTELIYCDGQIVAQEIIAPTIKTASGHSLLGVYNSVVDLTSIVSEINSNLTPEFISASGGSISIATSATSTVVASIKLSPGLWYITCNTRWEATNTTGLRTMYFTNSSTPGTIRTLNTAQAKTLLTNANGFNTVNTTQVLDGIVRITAETTMYLHVSQTSGSALATAYNSIAAYKITSIVV